MVGIKKLEKELTITEEDWDSISKRTKDSFQSGAGVQIGFLSDYAFNCKCCEEVAPHLNPYQIRKSDRAYIEDLSEVLFLVDLKNIFRIKKNQEPEYYSNLNYVEEVGSVCDHCFESVYDDE